MKPEKLLYDNCETIDTLIKQYDDFKAEFRKAHKEMIENYLSLICKKTGIEKGKKNEPKKWWIHQDCVLGIYWKEEKEPRIGIECVFEEESHKHPLGLFHIYVASWDKPTFGCDKQQQAIDKEFPNKKERDKKRKFRLVAALVPDDKDIIPTLENTYNKLKEIIEEHEDA